MVGEEARRWLERRRMFELLTKYILDREGSIRGKGGGEKGSECILVFFEADQLVLQHQRRTTTFRKINPRSMSLSTEVRRWQEKNREE